MSKFNGGNNESFEELLNIQLHTAISDTKNRIDLLKTHAATFKLALSNTEKSELDSILVHLGDDYFVEKSKKDAEAFISSRIATINHKVDELEKGVEQMNRSIEQLNTEVFASQSKANVGEMNEEGLPFAEIIEELDEDGNVISAKVNSKETMIDEEIVKSSIKNDPVCINSEVNKDSTEKNDSKDLEEKTSDKTSSNIPNHEDQEDCLSDLLKEMHVYEESNAEFSGELEEKKLTLIDDISESSGIPESASKDTPMIEGSYSINTDNILELELIADQFVDVDPPTNANDEVDEWDYEFADVNTTDEEDDIADEILYGENPVFFANNTQTDNLLWREVAKLRSNGNSSTAKKLNETSNGKKSVRFANKLDIKEIENISDSLKDIRYEEKVSLFKQSRSNSAIGSQVKLDSKLADSNPRKLDIGDSSAKKIDVNSTFNEITKPELLDRKRMLEESFKNSENLMLYSEILEPDSNVTSTDSLINESVKPKVSKFKLLKQNQQTNTPTNFAKETKNVSSENFSTQIMEERIVERCSVEPQSKPKSVVDLNSSTQSTEDRLPRSESDNLENSNHVPDESNSNELMKNMMRAYISGEYDDDIETKGPVVNHLDDFEELNALVESRLSQSQINEDEDSISENNLESDDENSENYEILREQILENEIHYEFSDDFEEENSINDHILEKEVSENYHKLRQKLIFDKRFNGYRKTEEEMEYEPIDESGNSMKISRFKAARLR